MIDNYLRILEESLDRKAEVLDEIMEYNRAQEQLLRQENVSMDELDANMEQKDALIQKLAGLDEGFESLYERIREQLQENKDVYREQIKRLQGLIAQVTEKSVSVQAQEARNKKLVEDYFMAEKSQLRQGKKALKAAYGYYKSMSKSNVVESQFVDQKIGVNYEK